MTPDTKAEDFSGLKNLRQLEYFKLYRSAFTRKEYDKIKAFLPANCKFKD